MASVAALLALASQAFLHFQMAVSAAASVYPLALNSCYSPHDGAWMVIGTFSFITRCVSQLERNENMLSHKRGSSI